MGARDLLAELSGSGLTVTADGDRLVIRPASKLTDTHRDALRRAKPELLALLSAPDRAGGPADTAAVAWGDADITRFLACRARMLRWGWREHDAEAMAERLVKRDRAHDDRVSCAECHHYRPGRCGNHQHAGLQSPELGRDLALMLQRCPGIQQVR
jgi:hypothetical protein